jgi:hypothetical protein
MQSLFSILDADGTHSNHNDLHNENKINKYS